MKVKKYFIKDGSKRTQLRIKETMERQYGLRYKLIIEGILVGALTGVVVSMFRWALSEADKVRETALAAAEGKPAVGICLAAFLAVIAMVTAALVRWESLISGSGIPQVKGEMLGKLNARWLKVLSAKFIGGVLAIGGGMALGREGPSIQLGAMVGKGFSEANGRGRTEEKLLMTCGAGGGLAAAFGAPLAGVMFALEELHKNFSAEVLLGTMASAITGEFVSAYIFGLSPVFDLELSQGLPLSKHWMVLVLGVMLGVIGVAYNKLTDVMQGLFKGLKGRWQLLRIAAPWAVIILLAIAYPVALGSGHHLVDFAGSGEATLKVLVALLLVKFCFSIFCFSTGAPGGIFLPLLVLGSLSGGIFVQLAAMVEPENVQLAQLFVTFGMVGMFSAIVRAPLTGVILICEMTGSLSDLLPMSLVAFAAYVTAELLGSKPIYDQLLDRLLEDKKLKSPHKANKVLVESQVLIGSAMEGMTLAAVTLPEGCLAVSVERNGKELIPNGSTVMEGGDKIVILCSERQITELEEMLEKQFKVRCK